MSLWLLEGWFAGVRRHRRPTLERLRPTGRRGRGAQQLTRGFNMNWIFQYKPTDYDLDSGLRRGLTDWWAMNQNYRLAQVGDTVFFLRSGYGAAITAVGEIVTATYSRDTHYGKHSGSHAVDVHIQHLVQPELSRSLLSQNGALLLHPLLTGGHRGTNFKLSTDQSAALEQLVDGRLRDAKSWIAEHDPQPALKRSDTALSGSLEAIRTVGGRVLAVQVQFGTDPQDDISYQDRLLANGNIILIGRGKRTFGNQKDSHGNAALLTAIKKYSQTAFPVYEKWYGDRYRCLGRYTAIAFKYSELNEAAPGYKVFRFILQPASNVADEARSESVQADFENDVMLVVSPERKQRIVTIMNRNRALAFKVKHDANYRCERCGLVTEWLTDSKKPYLEVHHIIPLGQDGFDELRNMIALCADCHRMLHMADERAAHTATLRAARGLP
jgi:HNH endonuclease/EVE domain